MKTKPTTIAWMTDLHFDRVTARTPRDFLQSLSHTEFEYAVVTGDISKSDRLIDDLDALADACINRNLYFVLGNHDFYGSNIGAVERQVTNLCRRRTNLHHLGEGRFHKLSPRLGILGHRGWADGRAGCGNRTRITSSDFDLIADFRESPKGNRFLMMEKLGRQSARYMRKELPYALASAEQVICATHFPPFYQTAQYDRKRCGYGWQPHFTNLSMGYEILSACKKRPSTTTTVLCGHTHGPVQQMMGRNINVRVGGSSPGQPRFEILKFS